MTHCFFASHIDEHKVELHIDYTWNLSGGTSYSLLHRERISSYSLLDQRHWCLLSCVDMMNWKIHNSTWRGISGHDNLPSTIFNTAPYCRWKTLNESCFLRQWKNSFFHNQENERMALMSKGWLCCLCPGTWRVSARMWRVWRGKWYNSGSKWTYCWVQMSLDARWREEENDACFVEKVHQGAENRRKQWHEELTVITNVTSVAEKMV